MFRHSITHRNGWHILVSGHTAACCAEIKHCMKQVFRMPIRKKRLKTVNLQLMRPRQNLANCLFCIAFLLLKKQTPPWPGKQHAQLWHGNLSFYFPLFMKGTDTSIFSSFVTCALILKGQSQTPRRKSRGEKGHWRKLFLSRKRAFSDDAGGCPHVDVGRNSLLWGESPVAVKFGVLKFCHPQWLYWNKKWFCSKQKACLPSQPVVLLSKPDNASERQP